MGRVKGRDFGMTIYLQHNIKSCTYHIVQVHIDRENCECDWGHPREDWYLSVLLFGVYSIQSHGSHLALFEPVVR